MPPRVEKRRGTTIGKRRMADLSAAVLLLSSYRPLKSAPRHRATSSRTHLLLLLLHVAEAERLGVGETRVRLELHLGLMLVGFGNGLE